MGRSDDSGVDQGGSKPVVLNLELAGISIVFLLLLSIITGSMYFGQNNPHEIPEDNRSIRSIINSGLDEVQESFFREVTNGDYRITAYRWYVGKGEDAPDAVPLGEEGHLTSEFLFNQRYIESARGIGFKVYKPTAIDPRTRIKCFGVFLNDTTKMDEWLREGTSFTFDYFPYPMDRRVMENCHVTRSGIYRTGNGTIFRTYFWDCSVIWEGSRPSTITSFR